MTIGQLKEAIENLPDDMEVRLAEQIDWPFEYSIGEPQVVSLENGTDVMYLPEADEIGYLPDGVTLW